MRIGKKVKALKAAITRKFNESGFALILTLMITLVLVLLALALLLQSDTETLMAVNEEDSQKAFMAAEEGVQWAKRIVYDRTVPSSWLNFTSMLVGNDGVVTPSCGESGGGGDDNLIDFDLNGDGTGDLNTTLARNQLNVGNEQTTSIIIGTCNGKYEVFRRGIDTNGDGIWDGPRALVWVRIDDNFDDSPAANDKWSDTDQRTRATIFAEYPIFVSAGTASTNGVELVPTSKRGLASRQIRVEFGPQSSPAISTNGSLTLTGQVRVCGECSNIHANQDVTLNACPHVCSDATASGTYTNSCDPPTNVSGLAAGGQPTITLPVINPYDQRWVPSKTVFNTTISPEAGLPAELQCGPYDGSHLGRTKYFAFVADAVGNGKIYKAYPDDTYVPPPLHPNYTKWNWYLIDDLNVGGDVRLDDCGQIATASGDPGARGVDAGAAVPGLADGGPAEFYGFHQQHVYEEATCSDTDLNLSGGTLVQNNWTRNNSGSGVLSPTLFITPAPSPDTLVLPGWCPHFDDTTVCTDNATPTPHTDSTPDFDVTKVKPTDSPSNRGLFLSTSNTVYSPLYNAVIFVWGHIRLAGNLSNLQTTVATVSMPNSHWRASFITTGYIDVSGTPAYATAVNDQLVPNLFIAGRDVELSGNAAGGQRECGKTGDTFCEVSGTVASFAGFVGAHEQIDMSGNTSLDGFMIAEDAANCGTKVNSATGISTLNGNPSVIYDCVHPPNPFKEGIKPLSWQEVQ